ncbi:MAG TPA: glycosyltransferase [Gaiellaceae bacterium]|jgi:UDP-N-acetylglucosamine transferase subunit ALG13|nr:glycosyltransferase [Gaiellaceae bacterium]
MIFVSLGTSDPFDRLLRAANRLPRDEPLVVQCGASPLRPFGATCFDFLPFERVLELMREARVVVTHAGVGSIMAARTVGKRPIVVPRLSRFGEAVDDHQVALARRLHAVGLVTLVEDPDELAAAVAAEHSFERATSGGALVEELRGYLAVAVAR